MMTTADLIASIANDHLKHRPDDHRLAARTMARLLLTGNHDQALDVAGHYFLGAPTPPPAVPSCGDLGEEQEEIELEPIETPEPVREPAAPQVPEKVPA